MAEFIVNPRRAPRAPARCRAAVVSTQGWFEAETEDIGSMGCQLVSPRFVRKGDLVRLDVTNPKVAESMKVSGRVAWVSPQAPWRVGIAFDDGSREAAARWFDALVAAHPGLGGYRRVPDRIRADATVYLGPPPRFLLDFTADEAMLLRQIASGARLDELMVRLRDRWPVAQRALFSLVARQAITFQRGQAVHPDSWKKILSDVEASLAVEALGKEPAPLVAPPPPPPAPRAPPPVSTPSPPPGPYRPVPAASVYAPPPGVSARAALRDAETWAAPAHAPAHAPAPLLDLPPDDGPPLEVATPAAAASWSAPGSEPARTVSSAPGLATPVPAPDFAGAGGGWRSARTRSAEAQAVYERALEELQAGSVNGALALLRRALQLAPGDPEIAHALGALAFKDRQGTP